MHLKKDFMSTILVLFLEILLSNQSLITLNICDNFIDQLINPSFDTIYLSNISCFYEINNQTINFNRSLELIGKMDYMSIRMNNSGINIFNDVNFINLTFFISFYNQDSQNIGRIFSLPPSKSVKFDVNYYSYFHKVIVYF